MKKNRYLQICLLFLIILVTDQSCHENNNILSLRLDYNIPEDLAILRLDNLSNEYIYLPCRYDLILYTKVSFKDKHGDYVLLGNNLYQTIVFAYEKYKSIYLGSITLKDSLDILNSKKNELSSLDSLFVDLKRSPLNKNIDFFEDQLVYLIDPQMQITEQFSLKHLLFLVKLVFHEYGFTNMELSLEINLRDQYIDNNKKYRKTDHYRKLNGILKSNKISTEI